jgi:phosphoenolpyruvate carboxykinase (ATP)
MNLKYTRAMVTAALNGELEKAEFVTDPYFGVQVPTSCPGVPDEQMIPAKQWGDDQSGYDTKAKELAKAFVENFKQYTHMSDDVVAAGPQA